MRLSNRRSNTSVAFVDSASEEVLLLVAADADAKPRLAYRLYDSCGDLIACADLTTYPEGVIISAPDGEVLLEVPGEPDGVIRYRLYNRQGYLTTCSDGTRTQIFGSLRMDSAPLSPRPRPPNH